MVEKINNYTLYILYIILVTVELYMQLNHQVFPYQQLNNTEINKVSGILLVL